MKLKNLCLTIGIAVLSVPALASTNWSDGTFNATLDIGGTITPSDYTQNWRWKTGDALTGLNKNILEMTDNSRKLTVTFSKKTAILLGETVEGIKSYAGLSGMTPQISFSDISGNEVVLQQDTSNAVSKGHLTLDVRNKDDQKIGSLKLNVTSAGMAVTPKSREWESFGLQARQPGEVFYGGLFPRSAEKGHSQVSGMISPLGVKTSTQLRSMLTGHPEFVRPSTTDWLAQYTSSVKLGQVTGLYAFAYGMYIDNGQELEATFDNPVSSTTNWKSKLNVSITYL